MELTHFGSEDTLPDAEHPLCGNSANVNPIVIWHLFYRCIALRLLL